MRGCDVALVGYEDEENLGLRSIAATLRQAGVRVDVVACSPGANQQVLERLRESGPRLVGFSLIFQGMLPGFAELIAYLRTQGVTAHFTMGGHFPTIAWKETLSFIPGLDSVVRHEGEVTLLELVRHLDERAVWEELPGLAFRRGNDLVATPARPLVTDLDALPPPLRHTEVLSARGVGVVSLLASRGCYYDCAFCSVRAFYGGATGALRRTRTPTAVVDEMERLYGERGARVFIFKDDDLATRGGRARGWIAEFAAALARRGLGRKVLWRISCRVDDLDPSILSQLQEVGLTWVYLGIESGSDLGLRTFHKRYTVKDIWRGIGYLRELGMAFDYGFMLLDPESTLESVAESAQFLGELGAGGDVPVHFTKMYPYVGTPVAARLKQEGRLVGTLAAPDYPFHDSRLALLQEFLARGFHERNFGATGMVATGRVASFDAELMRSFCGGRGTRRYERAIRRLTAEANAIAVSGVLQAVSVLSERDLSQCWDAWPYLEKLAEAAHNADQELAGQLRGVMADSGYEPLRPHPCEAIASASPRESATNGSIVRGLDRHSSAAARHPPPQRAASGCAQARQAEGTPRQKARARGERVSSANDRRRRSPRTRDE